MRIKNSTTFAISTRWQIQNTGGIENQKATAEFF